MKAHTPLAVRGASATCDKATRAANSTHNAQDLWRTSLSKGVPRGPSAARTPPIFLPRRTVPHHGFRGAWGAPETDQTIPVYAPTRPTKRSAQAESRADGMWWLHLSTSRMHANRTASCGHLFSNKGNACIIFLCSSQRHMHMQHMHPPRGRFARPMRSVSTAAGERGTYSWRILLHAWMSLAFPAPRNAMKASTFATWTKLC